MATITTTTPPSDLTGYTVTFGESPHLTRYGGGTLDLNGVISCQGYSQVFNLDFDGIYNSISPNYAFNYSSPQNSVTQENYVGIYGGVTLIDAMYGSLISITFNGGSDSSNSSFIQWLVDNNATFTKEGEEETPETPTTSKMKLEVLYKGEVIGSLSEGESITLHLNGSKLTEDLVVRAVADEVTPEEQTYTITAGTYIFKETLDTSIDVFIGVDRGIGCTYYTGHGLFEGYAAWIRIMDGAMDFGDNTGLRSVYYSKDGWTYQWRTNYESEALYGEIPKEYLPACRTITFEQDIETDRDFYEWFTANAVPKLSAPTITINGAVITITDISGLATEFGFYHNGTPLFTTSDTVVNLSEKLLDTFGAGTYNITVTALAEGYEESDHSNEVECVVGQTYTLSGSWLFNSAITGYSTGYSISAADSQGFLCYGTTYYRIENVAGTWEELSYDYIRYGDLYGTSYTTVNKSTTGWIHNNYRTITFNGTWYVDKEFYDWFTANATKNHSGGTYD